MWTAELVFLFDRNIRVCIGKILSNSARATTDVLQISVMGPLLFVLFMNEKLCNKTLNTLTSRPMAYNSASVDLNACIYVWAGPLLSWSLQSNLRYRDILPRMQTACDNGIVMDKCLALSPQVDTAVKKATQMLHVVDNPLNAFQPRFAIYGSRSSAMLCPSLVALSVERQEKFVEV